MSNRSNSLCRIPHPEPHQRLAGAGWSAPALVTVPLICNGFALPIETENVQVLGWADASVLALSALISQQASRASVATGQSRLVSTRGTTIPWDFSGSNEAVFAW
jgi:hypothetical protein